MMTKLFCRALPHRALGPGPLGAWTLDPAPRGAALEVLVGAHEVGLHFVAGVLVETLGPGRYVLPTSAHAPATFRTIDLGRLRAQAMETHVAANVVRVRLVLEAEYALEDGSNPAPPWGVERSGAGPPTRRSPYARAWRPHGRWTDPSTPRARRRATSRGRRATRLAIS